MFIYTQKERKKTRAKPVFYPKKKCLQIIYIFALTMHGAWFLY